MQAIGHRKLVTVWPMSACTDAPWPVPVTMVFLFPGV